MIEYEKIAQKEADKLFTDAEIRVIEECRDCWKVHFWSDNAQMSHTELVSKNSVNN